MLEDITMILLLWILLAMIIVYYKSDIMTKLVLIYFVFYIWK